MSKLLLAGTTAVAMVWSAAAHAEKWDMPMAYSATNYHSETGAKFAACVTENTAGDIEIVTHPSGSLFPGAQIKRAVQTGQAQIGERLLSGHQNENALFGWDSIPFLVTGFEAHANLWNAAEETITQLLADQNLVLLYSVPWPPQGLYFREPINSVADMDGIKFRSYNNATSRLAELTGMLPVVIEAAEISQAFATGVADSMISSGATGYDRKVWESLTHFYEADAWLPRNYVFVNGDVWSGVSDENKAIIQNCASEAQAEGLQRAKDYTSYTLEQLAANGMEVGPPSDQLKADLQAVGETMTAEWLEAAGAQGQAIIDAFNASN
ncbi:MAG: TRAP transporter substrate-binding protein [Pseudomonadota bacterium]